MNLRPYQLRAIQEILRVQDRRPVLVLPTGAGKTFTAAMLVRELRRPTLWIAHRRELIQQAAERLQTLGLRVGVIMAAVPENRSAQVQVASIQTLARRTCPPAGLVIVDEVHHAKSATYEKVLSQYPSAMILGLTATPFRLDGKGLGDVFHELVVAAYPDELCADGTLMAPAVYAPPAPDLRDVHITHGDYSGKDLSRVMDKPRLVGDIIATWERLAEGRRTVVFAVDVEHSKHLIEAFHNAGVIAAHLDGSSSRLEREAVLHGWRSGKLTVVSNCELFGEGFDLPALECAILARPTASLCLHLQQIGRVMRSAEGKDEPIVLDHAGNHHRHGRVTDRIEYSLTDRVARPSDREGLATFKQCRSCFLICSLSAQVCPACGAPFVSQGRDIQQEDGELVRLEAARRNAPFAERRDYWKVVEDQRNAYGYRVGWSEHRYRARYGEWPTLAGRDLVNLAAPSEDQKKKVYLELLGLCRKRGWKDGRAYHMYLAKFGEKPPYKWRLEKSA